MDIGLLRSVSSIGWWLVSVFSLTVAVHGVATSTLVFFEPIFFEPIER